MITQFRAQNFGCFDQVSVDLDPFTVLIGRNASGKSTVLRGLRTLALLTRVAVTNDRGQLLSLTHSTDIGDLFRNSSEPLRLGVDVSSPTGEGSYDVVLENHPSRDSVHVVEERVGWEGENGRIEYDSGTDSPLQFDQGRFGIKSSDVPRTVALPYLAHPTFKDQVEPPEHLTALFDLVDGFAPFYVYRFSPRAVARPAAPGATLSHDGRGLVAQLDELLGENRADFDYIEQQMSELFDHIESVVVKTRDQKGESVEKELRIKTVDGRIVPAELESDGALLSLAYLLLERWQSAGFGVEEPETGAHPELLRGRVERLRRIEPQVVVTTQSPSLLMEVGDVSAVRICDGGSVFQPEDRGMGDIVHRRLAWTTID